MPLPAKQSLQVVFACAGIACVTAIMGNVGVSGLNAHRQHPTNWSGYEEPRINPVTQAARDYQRQLDLTDRQADAVTNLLIEHRLFEWSRHEGPPPYEAFRAALVEILSPEQVEHLEVWEVERRRQRSQFRLRLDPAVPPVVAGVAEAEATAP
jgi:hypothetical protein